MDKKEIPRYTAYTDEEIEEIKRTSEEVGRLKEEQKRLKEELFNFNLQISHNKIGGMGRW